MKNNYCFGVLVLHLSYMKKIFWTTVFWLLLIFLFRSYLRLFKKPLSRTIGSRFGIAQQVCLTGATSTIDFTQQLGDIQTQLNLITQKLQSEPEAPVQTSPFQTTGPTKVALYYFNQIEDQKLAPEQQVNINSILPVYRIFPVSNNLLIDTINELIKWNLTSWENSQWFVTEFPNTNFKLLSADLAGDGILSLQFTEVPGFTDGWSARMLILWNVIQKTALQFPNVKKVVFTPETIFQP